MEDQINSQGHAAYASDALLVTKMNLNPGGSVSKLRDGWFLCDGCRISQLMVFPIDHPTNPDKLKGIKFSLSGDYGDRVCFWNAKSQKYAL